MPTPRCFDAKPKESWGLKPFCPAWPTYALPAEPSSLLSDAVRRALRPFEAGVSADELDAALAPRCAQRLCMRVQILRGRVYVVAPHAKRCAEFHTPASPCSPYQRQRTPGLTKPNFWNPAWYPTTLEWHFYASINMSDCTARVRPGDWNGPFSRQRLLTALRLLDEAARRDFDERTAAGQKPQIGRAHV